MIAGRFVPAVCALVAIALIPTYIHSYAGSTVQDGRRSGSISESLAEYQGTSSGRNATWGKRRFDSDDWTERIYRSSGDEVKLTVIRSYDPKSLYHHPELAVSYGPSYQKSEIRRLAGRPEIPVHVLSTNGRVRTIALYALQVGGRP
jgi:hypothetical protein